MNHKIKKALKINAFLFLAILVSILFHNLISGLLKTEESVFFILTIALAIVFPLSLFYTTTLITVWATKKDSTEKKEQI